MIDERIILWQKYHAAKMFFDQAIDQRNEALAQAESWKRVAEWRYRRSTTWVVGLAGFVLGLFAAVAIVGLLL